VEGQLQGRSVEGVVIEPRPREGKRRGGCGKCAQFRRKVACGKLCARPPVGPIRASAPRLSSAPARCACAPRQSAPSVRGRPAAILQVARKQSKRPFGRPRRGCEWPGCSSSPQKSLKPPRTPMCTSR
jgi:hypothetical protein